MLFARPDGEGIEIASSLKETEVRDRLIEALKGQGESVTRIAAILNVSRQHVHKRLKVLRREAEAEVRVAGRIGSPGGGEALSPPGSVPLFGADPYWSPTVEQWRHAPEACPRCGGPAGAIHPGSALYCPACTRTGVEGRIAAERARDEARERAKAEAEDARRRAELEGRRLARMRRKARAG